MDEQEKIRAFAREVYDTQFKPHQCEDEWYEFNNEIDVNIFQWEGEKPYANVYRVVGGNTDTKNLIDDFEV